MQMLGQVRMLSRDTKYGLSFAYLYLDDNELFEVAHGDANQ